MYIHNLTHLNDLSKQFDSIVIIGKGKNADKYIFDKEKIAIITINDSIYEYRNNVHGACIVEGHITKNIPRVFNKRDIVDSIILIQKAHIQLYQLIVGCTPTIVISYLLKHTDFKNIFLQGFSMDGKVVTYDPLIEEKIKEFYTLSLEIYKENNDLKTAYEYFRDNISTFIGVMNHYPYDWNRQVIGFDECFKLADKLNKNLAFITDCTRKCNSFRYENKSFKHYLSL